MRIKKIISIVLIFTMLLCITGCEGVSLSEEEEQLYVDYAVNAVINHDNNYMLKLKDVEIETETETIWLSEENSTAGEKETVNTQSSDETTPVLNVNTDLNSILKLDGISVTYKDYIMTESYPKQDDMAFVIKAVDGSNLIIVELNVTNTTQSDINLNMSESGISFKGIFNGQVRTNCQTTFLINAFNTFNGTLKANETKELVLVFEASQQNLQSVSTIKLEVRNGDLSDIIILKN